MAVMTIQGVSVAANATTTNQVAGQVDEILTRTSAIRLRAAGSALGLNATLLVGKRSMSQDQPCSGANRFPIIPDDVVVTGYGRPGERIILTFRNTTGGALTINAAVDVEPVTRRG